MRSSAEKGKGKSGNGRVGMGIADVANKVYRTWITVYSSTNLRSCVTFSSIVQQPRQIAGFSQN